MTTVAENLAKFSTLVPEGDDKERLVCDDCGFILYDNPKIIAGSVVTRDNKFLLCKRSIEPRAGYWTLPAGFMELGETPAEGAMREAFEEATAQISIKDMLAVYTVKRISQVQIFFRATLTNADIKPGIESTEVGLFAWDEIPWDDLAFPSVHWALKHFKAVEGEENFAPFSNPEGWENV